MNTVTIDSQLYNEAVRYATKERMTLSGLFELAVRRLMYVDTPQTSSKVIDRKEFQKALDYMNLLMSEEDNLSVPADEDGKAERLKKYL